MILIIDDDHAVRTSLLLLLQQEGYISKDVSSPNEALAWLNHNTPSLIILDLNFSIETSGDEGIKLLNQIRKIHPGTPVILITGWATIELAVRGMKAN
jgi:two-component system, NtrC family, response regulator